MDDISYEWLSQCQSKEQLEKAVKLIEEDGNYFVDLKMRILEKINKLKGDAKAPNNSSEELKRAK